MARGKKSSSTKKSVTSWLERGVCQWLDDKAAARNAQKPNRTGELESALETMRAMELDLEGRGAWREVLAQTAAADANLSGSAIGATLAGLVAEALERRGRK